MYLKHVDGGKSSVSFWISCSEYNTFILLQLWGWKSFLPLVRCQNKVGVCVLDVQVFWWPSSGPWPHNPGNSVQLYCSRVMQQSHFLCHLMGSKVTQFVFFTSGHEQTLELLSRCNKTPAPSQALVSILGERWKILYHPLLPLCAQIQPGSNQIILAQRRTPAPSVPLPVGFGVCLTLEAESCCLVSSLCEIRLEACSLARSMCVCVSGEKRWQLGSITHPSHNSSRGVSKEPGSLARSLTDSVIYNFAATITFETTAEIIIRIWVHQEQPTCLI